MGTRIAVRPRACVGLLALLLVSSVRPVGAVEGIVQAGSAEAPLALDAASGQLQLASGETVELPQAARVAYRSLAALADGWAAAGSRGREDGASELFVVRSGAVGEAPRALRPPAGSATRLRQSPVLLADGGELAGIAWLEGDEAGALAVRAARWNGRRFTRPERVAETGPGSQLALSGTVLSDGSWLLAWSAFDGEDDEILWSQRIGGRWLAPQPVSAPNAVPDITPALTAAGTGAMLAWSRYDGNDYRLRLARFSYGSWEGETTVGAAGSLYPDFVASSSGLPRLVYRDAGAAGWAALDLDASGSPLRRAEVSAAPRARPLVTAGTAEGLTFRWPAAAARDAESASELTAAWLPVARELAP